MLKHRNFNATNFRIFLVSMFLWSLCTIESKSSLQAQVSNANTAIHEGYEYALNGTIGSDPATMIIQVFTVVDSPNVTARIQGHYYLNKDEISIPFTGVKTKDKMLIQSVDGTAELIPIRATAAAVATDFTGTWKLKNKQLPIQLKLISEKEGVSTTSKRRAIVPLLKLDHTAHRAHTVLVIAWPTDLSDESKAIRSFSWENLLSLENLGEEESSTSKFIAMPNPEDVDVVVQQMKRIDKKLQSLTQMEIPDISMVDTMSDGIPDYLYTLHLQYKRDFTSNKFQNHSYQWYQFSGGAHGTYGINTLCIDAQTGTVIELEKRIPNAVVDKIPTLLKKYYLGSQNQQLLPKEKPYKSLSQLLFVEEFPGLGPNTYCTDLGLTTYWGLYEIAPYSSGIVSVTIPWKELK